MGGRPTDEEPETYPPVGVKMKKLGAKIRTIKKTDPHRFTVSVVFTDRLSGTISLQHLFEKPRGLAAEVLRGDMFNKCFVEMGALAWPNGLELCPDALHEWLLEQNAPAYRSVI